VAHVAIALCAPSASAQGLPPNSSLVLRPSPELARVAAAAGRVVARRTGVAVLIGEAPPPDVLEAVPTGHVAIAERDGRVVVVLGAPSGLTYESELELDRSATTASAPRDADVRALAIVIESLRDSAIEGPAAESAEASTEGSTTPSRTLIRVRRVATGPPPPEGPPPRDLPKAKPTIYLRALFGVSLARGTLLAGPGTGLGLCVAQNCVVLEGDLPLAAEQRTARDGAVVRYRFVTFSMRFQYRPFRWGRFTPAGAIGLLTRVGTATLSAPDVSRVASDLGLRGTLELAYRFVPRFEVVLEAGLDFVFDRARFIRFGEVVVLEDQLTPWVVASLRLRP